jgi:TctA family transporter
MLSALIPILVLLLTAASSYTITRPIGDGRRHIWALLVSLALGVVGAVTVGALHEATYEAAFLVTLVAAIVGATLGMIMAWRRRSPIEQPQTQSKPRRQSSRRPHYGISRA